MSFVIVTIDWAMDCAKFTIIISLLKDAFIGQLAVHIIGVSYGTFHFIWFTDSWANRVVWTSSIVHSFCGWDTFLWFQAAESIFLGWTQDGISTTIDWASMGGGIIWASISIDI